MEILKLFIAITKTDELISDKATVRMLHFEGYCKSSYFNGEILQGAVDTQLINPDGTGTLSARYMIKGKDYENKSCYLYIDNNAIIGAPYTTPTIYTDSMALKWLEKEALTGKIENENGQLVIIIQKREAYG